MQTTQLKQRDDQVFEPLEQGKQSGFQETLKKVTVRSMKSHTMEKEADSTSLTILQDSRNRHCHHREENR